MSISRRHALLLFTAASNGIAAANLLTVRNGQQTTKAVTAGVSIDLAAADQTYLILYGTGLRNHKQPVNAWIGSSTLPRGAQSIAADYAGAQGTFAGEDQIIGSPGSGWHTSVVGRSDLHFGIPGAPTRPNSRYRPGRAPDLAIVGGLQHRDERYYPWRPEHALGRESCW